MKHHSDEFLSCTSSPTETTDCQAHSVVHPLCMTRDSFIRSMQCTHNIKVDYGMGQRVSGDVGKMTYHMVWELWCSVKPISSGCKAIAPICACRGMQDSATRSEIGSMSRPISSNHSLGDQCEIQ